ncbi:hypothetical protein [Variovorax sp. JS1663]|uniref:hypothetical protein n=1 Tax=Variovorax sp. JS1663 TaxID=1851577 RepID=UPI000B341E8E|nr:hypothetical protein [Variovorax sp. JS1663]OUM00477.1 hypothetical protein A8M77_20610 [Variovorax sp. JS1663]
MQDSMTAIDTSFDRWTQLSDAFEQHLSHMKQGDAKARAEAIRLARELDALTRRIARELDSGGSSHNA